MTDTDPISHTFPRSLRIKSTIITFSALSFSLLTSSFANSSSRILSSLVGLVPLIGRVSTRCPSKERNNSGEALRIHISGKFKYAEKGAGLASLRLRYNFHGSPSYIVLNRCDIFA